MIPEIQVGRGHPGKLSLFLSKECPHFDDIVLLKCGLPKDSQVSCNTGHHHKQDVIPFQLRGSQLVPCELLDPDLLKPEIRGRVLGEYNFALVGSDSWLFPFTTLHLGVCPFLGLGFCYSCVVVIVV